MCSLLEVVLKFFMEDMILVLYILIITILVKHAILIHTQWVEVFRGCLRPNISVGVKQAHHPQWVASVDIGHSYLHCLFEAALSPSRSHGNSVDVAKSVVPCSSMHFWPLLGGSRSCRGLGSSKLDDEHHMM